MVVAGGILTISTSDERGITILDESGITIVGGSGITILDQSGITILRGLGKYCFYIFKKRKKKGFPIIQCLLAGNEKDS